jgi:hypothetical protein
MEGLESRSACYVKMLNLQLVAGLGTRVTANFLEGNYGEQLAADWDGGSPDPQVEFGHLSAHISEDVAFLHIRRIQGPPDGNSQERNSPFNTRIDLPAAGRPACKLEIDERCLLEFHHIYYPEIENATQISGEVTLAGSIRQDGALVGITLVEAKADPPERRSVLVDWAKQNLSTWRFEPAKHKDAVRITYSFAVNDSLPGNTLIVQFRLPDGVKIETDRTRPNYH